MRVHIALTGGCGFLGQHLTKEILRIIPDASIHLLDLKAAPVPLHDFSREPRVRTSLGIDLLEAQKLTDALRGTDVLIHLAGLVSFSLKDKELLHRVNVEGTKRVLQAAKAAKVGRLIHVSSVAALGYSDDAARPVREDFAFDWRIAEKNEKHYMLTKHLADEAALKARKKGLDVTLVYPGLMFGPGDRKNSARLILALKKRSILFSLPGGTNIVDVRDVARAIASLAARPREGEYLLSGHNLSFKQVNAVISGQLEVRPPKLTVPRLLSAPLFLALRLAEKHSSKRLELTADNLDSGFKFRYFDNSKALRELGWQPHIPFEQTIEDTIAWMRSDGLLEK